MSDRDHGPVVGNHGVSVEVRLHTLELIGSEGRAETSAGSAIKIDNEGSVVVMNLMSEVEKVLDHRWRYATLLAAALRMLRHWKHGDLP